MSRRGRHNSSRRYMNATEEALYDDYINHPANPAADYDDDNVDPDSTQPYEDSLEDTDMGNIAAELKQSLGELNARMDITNSRLDTMLTVVSNIMAKLNYIHARVPQHNDMSKKDDVVAE